MTAGERPSDTLQTVGRHGPTMVALGVLGGLAAAYLAYTKLAGEVPACGPLRGCETVNTSPYSEFLGVPVAVFGLVMSAIVAAASTWWWRGRDRRGLYVAYGLGLLGLFAVAYLTYLEVFVIGAICAWCVGYAVTVVAGWLVALLALRAASRRVP